jgi:hypothetical protein
MHEEAPKSRLEPVLHNSSAAASSGIQLVNQKFSSTSRKSGIGLLLSRYYVLIFHLSMVNSDINDYT